MRSSSTNPGTTSARSLASLLNDPAISAVLDQVVPLIAAAGRITLLVAREKVGKSTLARAAAAAVSVGASFLGREVVQGTVLWLVLEEALADVVRKLQDFGPRTDAVWLLRPMGEDKFEELRCAVEAVRPRLIVIDTLSSYAADEGADENASVFWTRLIKRFRRLAEESGCAILLLHHATKRDGGGYRGSTAIGAAVDQIIEMQESDGSSAVRILQSKGRLELPSFSVTYDYESPKFNFEGELNAASGESPSMAAKRRMREFLRTSAIAAKLQVTKAAGVRAVIARQIFDEMVDDGEIVAVDGGYSLAPREALTIDRAA